MRIFKTKTANHGWTRIFFRETANYEIRERTRKRIFKEKEKKEWIPACAGMTRKRKIRVIRFYSCHSCSAVFLLLLITDY